MGAIFLVLILFSTQAVFAQTLRSSINFDVRSINTQRTYSKKVKIHVDDLHYTIPIYQKMHIFKGYLEFDPAFLLRKRKLRTNLISKEEVTDFIAKELERTKLELKFSNKYLYVQKENYSPLIKVDVTSFNHLSEKLLRVNFIARNKFPVQVKPEYQTKKKITESFKFKFKAQGANFFTQSKESKFKLILN